MKNIKQALAVFIIGFCILIMWLELILILAKNGLIVKILAILFQQNFDIIVSIIFILSLLCAIILSMAFYWAMQVHNVFNVQNMAHNMFSGKTNHEIIGNTIVLTGTLVSEGKGAFEYSVNVPPDVDIVKINDRILWTRPEAM